MAPTVKINNQFLAHRVTGAGNTSYQPRDMKKYGCFFDSTEIRAKGNPNLNPGEDTRIELYLIGRYAKIYGAFIKIRLRNDSASNQQLLNGLFFIKKLDYKDGSDQTFKTITDQTNYIWTNLALSEDERNTLAPAFGQQMTAPLQEFNDWSVENTFDGGYILAPGEERSFYIPIQHPIIKGNFDIGCNRTAYKNSSVTITMGDNFATTTSAGGEPVATSMELVVMGIKHNMGSPLSDKALRGTTQKSIIYLPAFFSHPVTISPGSQLEQIQVPNATGVTPLITYWVEIANNLSQENRYSSSINLAPQVPGDPDPRPWVPLENTTVYNEETIVGHSNMEQDFIKYVLNSKAGNNRIFSEKNIYQACVDVDAVKTVSVGGNSPTITVKQGYLKFDMDIGDYVSATGTDQAVLRVIIWQKATMQLGPHGFKTVIYSANV